MEANKENQEYTQLQIRLIEIEAEKKEVEAKLLRLQAKIQKGE